MYEKKGDMELYYGYDAEGQPCYIQFVRADGTTGASYLITNSKVNGFQIYGIIKKNTKGTVVYSLTYVWNDIIDPNYSYDTDNIKAKFAKIIARPRNYVIQIIWKDVSVINAKGGRNTGWLS